MRLGRIGIIIADDGLRESIAEDYAARLSPLFIHFHQNPELPNFEFETARRLAAEIRALGRRAVPIRADLLDMAAVRELVPRAAEALGGSVEELGTVAPGQLAAMPPQRVLGREVLRMQVRRQQPIPGLLGNLIVFPFTDPAETIDAFLYGEILAFNTRELLCNKERLAEESLELSCP